MKIKYIFLILLFCSYSLPIYCSEYVIKNKGYLDVTSGKLITGQYLYVKNKKIVKISKKFSPKNRILVDLSDSYLLPGLIDSHSHLLFTETLEDKGFENAALREEKLSDEFRISRAKRFLQQYLQYGFTTLFDLGNSGNFLDSKLKREIESDNNYPLLFISGKGIATGHAQFAPNAPIEAVKKEYLIVNSKTDFNVELKKYTDLKIDILKVYLDNSPGEGKMDESTLEKLLKNKFIRFFKKVTFHSITMDGSELIQKFKITDVEHFSSFYNSSNYDSIKFATPTDQSKDTLITFHYYSPATYIAQKNRTHFLKNTKIKILFGPDFYFNNDLTSFNRAQFVKESINAFVDAGLSPIEIIRAMTINPAISIKEEKHLGKIQTGGFANLIATKENPIEKFSALTNLHFIMNQGKIITMH